MNIYEKLLKIQTELKAPKGQYNSFGKYKYRSCEDILEAVKPICEKYKAVCIVPVKTIQIGERFYQKAVATLIDTEKPEDKIEVDSDARESETKKGMDDSQVTGATSSYARKYALNGLFCIDDTKDADTDEYKQQIDNDKLIDSKMVSGLNDAIEKANIEDKVVELILSQYGYTNTAEIKMKDYMNIVKDFKKEK